MGRRTTFLAGAAALALAVSVGLRAGRLAPLVLAAVFVAGSLVLGRQASAQRSGVRGTPAAFVEPIAACWLVLSIFPMHDFTSRSSGAAVSAVGLQPLTELVLFLGAGGVALAAIRRWEPELGAARPPAVLMLLPVWVVASSTWSATGPYALVRGVQMLVPPVLAWATIAIGRRDRRCVYAIVGLYLRLLIRVVLGLAVLGLAFGPRFVTVTAGNADRFTWIGAHPGPAGTLLAATLVVLLVAPSDRIGLHGRIRIGVVVAVAAAMYLNHTRTAWVAIVVSVAVAFFLMGRIRPRMLAVGIPLAGAVSIAAVWYQGSAIGDYILRNRDAENLSAGNGRRELWSIGVRSLDGAFDWVAGHGFGAVRTLFLAEAPWAGDAHNSVLSLLVGLGAVGVLLGGATWFAVGRGLIGTRAWKTSDLGVTVVALAIFVTFIGLTSDTLAEPNFGYVLVSLIGGVVLGPPAGGEGAAPSVSAHAESSTRPAARGEAGRANRPT